MKRLVSTVTVLVVSLLTVISIEAAALSGKNAKMQIKDSSAQKRQKVATDQKLRPIHVEKGVFLYPDGTEVALFGTNYGPMLWYQYVNMKALNADFRQAIRQDVSDMKACGVQIVRVHYLESESCDANGNLIKNDHLRVFDILVDELNRQGIYLFLTPLGWWESPCELPDAYSRKVTKMRMIYGEHVLSCSENFISQLLTHTNPYTSRQLKDEPSLVVIEILNEPFYWTYDSMTDPNLGPGWNSWQIPTEVFHSDYKLWCQLWRKYYERKGLSPSKGTYEKFQYDIMSTFLRRMIKAIHMTGAKQPIASSLFGSNGNPGIIKAIEDSEVEAVTSSWYPGWDGSYEFVNLMPEHAQPYELPPNDSPSYFRLPDPNSHKAEMIYEFDSCNTYNNVIMYPAIARRFRNMGVQIACQFQYDTVITAPYNTDWDSCYFNYETTPAKAVAFIVASKVFADIPCGIQYPKPSDNEIFYGTAISFEHQQVLRISEDEVYHAHPLEGWIPLKLPSLPKRIIGRGNSPYVEYTGSGLYKLEQLSPGRISLLTTRNTTVYGKTDSSFFKGTSLDKVRVKLDNRPEQFRLKLDGWNGFRCFDEKGQEVKVIKNTFELIPGQTYSLQIRGD